jgi:hypothetical protein
MIMPAGMVYGVPLAAGERVVYYHREDPGWQKPLLIVVGILMLVGIIGLFILIAGLMAKTTVYVVTTRRFIIIEGWQGKNVKQIFHTDVKEVTTKMTNSIVKWIDISDGKGTLLQYQAAANPKEMPELLEGWLKNPASLESAPTPWHDNLPSKKKKPLPASLT